MRSFPFTTGGNEDDDDDALTYSTIIRPTYHLYQLIHTPMTLDALLVHLFTIINTLYDLSIYRPIDGHQVGAWLSYPFAGP